MRPKVYIETTVPSYLTARPNRDLLRAAHQQVTREWWEDRRHKFDLFISQVVVQEVSAGDREAAAERLRALEGVPILEVGEEARELASTLIGNVPLPEKAAVDAAHIAIAVVGGMDYLLTWNCRHINNATLRAGIEAVCRSRGYRPPVICTPEELMEP